MDRVRPDLNETKKNSDSSSIKAMIAPAIKILKCSDNVKMS